MIKKIYLITIISLLFSCSERNDLLTEKYWTKYKKNQPNSIVKFTSDGKFINYNKLEKNYTYKIIQNRLIITDTKGEIKKYFIKSLSNKELKLTEIIEVGDPQIDYYKQAQIQDFFLGQWIHYKNNSLYIYIFTGDTFVTIDESKENITQQKKLKYNVKNDSTIQIGSQKFKYKFENDLKKLILMTPNNETLTLIRKQINQ